MASTNPTPSVLATMSKYRVYTSNDSFQSLQKVSFPKGEIQICLAFARDYDDNDNNTNGVFYPRFNEGKVTPDVISLFRQNSQTRDVKFLLSIGGRDKRYPFSPKTSEEKKKWITNAVNSLKDIITKYKFDGLDIYYNHIEPPMFTDAIGSVIKQLSDNGVISTASISPSAAPNDSYYRELFHNYKKYITTVAYQSQYESEPVVNVDGVNQLFDDLVNNNDYPKDKLLPGHTINPADWFTVSHSLFQAAIPYFLTTLDVPGISLWTVFNDDPEN